jgi:hypothetical protein
MFAELLGLAAAAAEQVADDKGPMTWTFFVAGVVATWSQSSAPRAAMKPAVNRLPGACRP